MSRENLHTISKRIQRKIHPGIWIIVGIFTLLGVIFGPTAFTALAATGDWPTFMYQDSHTGFNSSETIINPSTAPNLKVHWVHTAAGFISSQPVVANSLVYWGSWDGYEHATNNNNAKVWATNIGTTFSNCSFSHVGVAGTATIATVPINGTPTSVDFVGGGNANFYALNALNGTILWHTSLGSSPSHFIWGSTAVYNGSVYIGMASYGDCPLIQGQLIQLNASTGSIQHVFNVVPNGSIGGSVWGAPTIDESKGTIYFATGNCVGSPCPSSLPFADAVVEVHASDLSLVGYWQIPTSEQLFDTDFGNTPTLFTATLNGAQTPMVGVANKNGTFYAFRRDSFNSSGTGNPIWRAKLAIGGSCPECGQGSISGAAWDGTNLYIAGGNTSINGSNCKGSLRKTDPATGTFVWSHCMFAGPVLGAVTAVNGVVVVGEGTYVIVVNASTSATIFRFNDTTSGSTFFASSSISNGIMYMGNADGHLYAFGL
jgi:polyvinyl alcohol dehydrogenase (cytochrome)